MTMLTVIFGDSGIKVVENFQLQLPLLAKNGSKVVENCQLQLPLLLKSGSKVA